MAKKEKLILITNPGSSSRKYALYCGYSLLCSLHFEYEGEKVICTLTDEEGKKHRVKREFTGLANTTTQLSEILTEEGYLTKVTKLDAILARIVATGEYFSHDHIVDDECLEQLEIAKKRTPLHVPVVAAEIKRLRREFPGVVTIAISDSEFHNSRPDLMKYYAIDTELADKFEIKKYGAHGLSVGSIVDYMKEAGILADKTVVCHVGSGSSVTAVFKGMSHDTSMEYTPLAGMMMATRSGSMDPAAATAVKRALKITEDDELEEYLNKKCGLLGVSGQTDDMREIIRLRDEGDKRGTLAHAMFVYRLQAEIAKMVAALGGIDAIVFTATIGERSDEIRRVCMQKFEYLGFKVDEEKNQRGIDEGNRRTNIAAEGSKPIYVIKTDEFKEMIRKAEKLL